MASHVASADAADALALRNKAVTEFAAGIATLDEDGELDGLLESAGATQSAATSGGGKLFGIF